MQCMQKHFLSTVKLCRRLEQLQIFLPAFRLAFVCTDITTCAQLDGTIFVCVIIKQNPKRNLYVGNIQSINIKGDNNIFEEMVILKQT